MDFTKNNPSLQCALITLLFQKGGVVVLEIRNNFLTEAGKYHSTGEPWVGSHVEKEMQCIEQEKKWRLLERAFVPDLEPEDSGICFAFRVL